MDLRFSLIKNNAVFEKDFDNLSNENGTIKFKQTQKSGGIAVVYAPNGTGKTSIANLLSMEKSNQNVTFVAYDDNNNIITPESNAFHVIKDQINRNVIRGNTTDYLIGEQIRREYELRDKINLGFKNAYDTLLKKYKTEFKVSKVKNFFIRYNSFSKNESIIVAFDFIKDIINRSRNVDDLDKDKFLKFIQNNKNKPESITLDNDKRKFVIDDLSETEIIEKIINIDPIKIVPDKNTILIERHDDAIKLLQKYHSLDTCVVCDSESFDGGELLKKKNIIRRSIYDNLDDKTKDIIDNIVCDQSLINNDPFGIKMIIGELISTDYIDNFIELKKELLVYLNGISAEMITSIFCCFDGTTLFEDYKEYVMLTQKQPNLDSEELLFIESIINENIGKDISVTRDDNDRNYKLKIGDKDLLGTDRKDMELSTGEQNFISLAFELLLARHSDKEYIVLDDPISSFDSIYKNKIAYCIIKFLENKKQIILTHNTDMIRLLEFQYNNCYNLFILNNVYLGKNGFIPVSNDERLLLINLHNLISFFQNKDDKMTKVVHNKRQFLMSIIPFIRGYAHINLDRANYYALLSDIMHGYATNSLNLIPIYNFFFGDVFIGNEFISVSDILEIDFTKLDIIDRDKYPLLADTLEQSLIYYYLRMKVEKLLVDIFNIDTEKNYMLNQIIREAFECSINDLDYEKKMEFKVFFTSRKTLLNEFNHFEGNMNIFQPAIDIKRSALDKEVKDIEIKLKEVKDYFNKD